MKFIARFIPLIILLGYLTGCAPAATETPAPVPATHTLVSPTDTAAPPTLTAIPPTSMALPPTVTLEPTAPQPIVLEEGMNLDLTYSFVPNNSGAHMFDIYEVNQDGSKHQVLLKATTVGFNQPDWSPDGKVMAIWGWHNPRTISIYAYDTTTEELTRLTDQKNVYDMFPHWNRTGERIVFTRQYLLENDRNEIWSMNPDGSDQKKIVDGYAASWSPDGEKLVYSAVTDGNEDLYTCSSDGTNSVKLLGTEDNESFPQWSPNGQLIMFEQFNREKEINSYEIGVLNISNGEVNVLTQNNYLDSGARWSLDGSQIAFLSRYHGNDDFEIYVMNADGSGVKQVTHTAEGSYATFPSWRPPVKP